MPPKKNRPKPFSWAGGKGQLTDVAKGIVFGLHLCGTSAPDIAVLMQITKKSAYDTIRATAESIGAGHSLPQKAQEDAEEEGEDDTPRPSARDSMSPHQEKMLARKEKIEEWMDEKDEEGHYVMKTARDLRKRFREAEEEDNLVGLRTIQRDLKELNILWKAMPVSAGLKPSHIEKRLELAPYLASLDPTKLLFSDESYFDTNDTHRHAYQRDGEPQQVRRKEKYTSKVLVWGVIGYDFALLVILSEQSVTGESYAETLKKFLFPRLKPEHIFMQDNARPHTSRLVQQLLADRSVDTVTWPAKSPDLNPIENLWSIMKSRVDVDLYAKVEQLQEAVIKAWDSVSQTEINDLVMSFPDRIRKLEDRNGGNVQVKRCYL